MQDLRHARGIYGFDTEAELSDDVNEIHEQLKRQAVDDAEAQPMQDLRVSKYRGTRNGMGARAVAKRRSANKAARRQRVRG